MKHLFKGQYFGKYALEMANEFIALLTKHVGKTAKDVKARMKRLVKKEKHNNSQLNIEYPLLNKEI